MSDLQAFVAAIRQIRRKVFVLSVNDFFLDSFSALALGEDETIVVRVMNQLQQGFFFDRDSAEVDRIAKTIQVGDILAGRTRSSFCAFQDMPFNMQDVEFFRTICISAKSNVGLNVVHLIRRSYIARIEESATKADPCRSDVVL